MKSFADDADLGWQAYGNQLTQVKSAVDDMGKDVCRLESIRRALAPWQKHSVDRIATEVTLMADNTQDAIVFFNHHQGTLWRPKFETYVDNLYTQADDLTHSVGHAVQMAKVGPEYRELRHDMGVKASS
ncbi:MAG TPA: hypothetical protein VMG35_18565 [Bryobacteraceae bacterium]|nr:hypothetical protein [Bryobacteraceae bacterium]